MAHIPVLPQLPSRSPTRDAVNRSMACWAASSTPLTVNPAKVASFSPGRHSGPRHTPQRPLR